MKNQEYVYTAYDDWRNGKMIDGLKYYSEKNRMIPSSYVALEIATTGIYEKSDDIIRVDAARITDGIIVSEIRSYVKPKSFSPWDEVATNIDAEYLQNAPECEHVIQDLFSFIKNDLVVASNGRYIEAFINQYCEKFYKHFTILDLCRIYHFLHPETKAWKKSAVSHYALENYKETFSDPVKNVQIMYENIIIELQEHGISTVDELDLLWKEHLRIWRYRDEKEKKIKLLIGLDPIRFFFSWWPSTSLLHF